MLIIMLDSCVEAIAEKNSGGGRVVVHLMEDNVGNFQRLLKASILYFSSVRIFWNKSEQINLIEPMECAYRPPIHSMLHVSRWSAHSARHLFHPYLVANIIRSRTSNGADGCILEGGRVLRLNRPNPPTRRYLWRYYFLGGDAESSKVCPLGPHSMTRYWTLVKRDKKARVLMEEGELVRGSHCR